MLKKCKIVMLSTNEPSKIGNLATYQKRSLAKVIKEGINPKDSTLQFWNLYIISDDKIKKGDWVIEYQPKDNLGELHQIHNEYILAPNIQKKVIATTDESLYYKDISKNPKQYMGSYISMSLGENLPQPSQQFIEKYIEEYNKGQQITECLVEYEEIYPKHFTYNPNENIITRLKVDKNNTITIKKIKDSYSREEVIEFGNKVKEYCKDGWKLDSLHRVFFEWQKWIEENL